MLMSLLSNIFERIYNTIRITRLIISLSSNLSQIITLTSLLIFFFFIIKDYFLRLDLKLFIVFFDNVTFEVRRNIKNVNKIN